MPLLSDDGRTEFIRKRENIRKRVIIHEINLNKQPGFAQYLKRGAEFQANQFLV